MGKRGIIIANTGSPDNPSPEAVRAYLERFLSHPRIAPMSPGLWNVVMRLFILPKRSKQSAQKYELLWTDEGFPFVRDHDILARKVAGVLREQGETAAVACAMSFGNPSIPLVLGKLREAGCTSVDVLPLYPQNAYSQAYIVADQVRQALGELDWDVECRVIGDYSANEKYLAAVADSVQAAGFAPERGDRIVFGFHSIPLADIENGDTYGKTSKATAAKLAKALSIPEGQWACAYQSRFDKERKWLSPFALKVLETWAKEGFDGRLFYVCPNFSVDCLETHYEVEMVTRLKWFNLLEKNELELFEDSFTYIPCLGTSDAHVEVIADVLAHPAKLII